MKIKKFLSLGIAALMALSIGGLAACGSSDEDPDSGTTGGTTDSGSTSGGSTDSGSTSGGNTSGSSTTSAGTITVWCPTEVKSLMETQLANFKSQYSAFNYDFTIEEVSEGNAASTMITDATSGGDIYFFAQDQLARLVQAGALSQVSSTYASDVTSRNDASSVAAATLNSTLYAYPLTSDNGYFMYYDKSVITDESVLEDQTALIAACASAGKTINFNLGADGGWYTMGYFFATGCSSTWTTDDDGNFNEPVDTINSPNGQIAVRGMAELVNSGSWVDAHDASALGEGAAVVVSGTWDYSTAYGALGDNLGCTDLWSFTVDGTSYHLGSFIGNKLLGVKPTTDATKAAWLQALANYLSGETCQLERFNANSWGPSNTNAQDSSEVQASPALAAIAAQAEYATPQGQYPNDWWTAMAAIGEGVYDLKTTTPTDEQVKSVLDNYSAAINEITAVVTQLGIVGSFNNWNNADETYCISYENNTYANKTESSPLLGTWEFEITLAAGDMFRVVKFGSWDTYVGYSNITSDSASDLTGNGDDNIIIATAGTYTISIDMTSSTYSIKVVLKA